MADLNQKSSSLENLLTEGLRRRSVPPSPSIEPSPQIKQSIQHNRTLVGYALSDRDSSATDASPRRVRPSTPPPQIISAPRQVAAEKYLYLNTENIQDLSAPHLKQIWDNNNAYLRQQIEQFPVLKWGMAAMTYNDYVVAKETDILPDEQVMLFTTIDSSEQKQSLNSLYALTHLVRLFQYQHQKQEGGRVITFFDLADVGKFIQDNAKYIQNDFAQVVTRLDQPEDLALIKDIGKSISPNKRIRLDDHRLPTVLALPTFLPTNENTIINAADLMVGFSRNTLPVKFSANHRDVDAMKLIDRIVTQRIIFNGLNQIRSHRVRSR